MTLDSDATDRTLLGVGANASAEEINVAYRSRMRDTHPDLGRDDDPAVHELMTRLADARRRLLVRDDAGPRPAEWVPPDVLERDDAVSARTVRRTIRLFVLTLVLVSVVLVVFTIIAFSQSG